MKVFALILLALAALAGCTTTNYTANTMGASNYTVLPPKNFDVMGTVAVTAIETHHSGPLGLVKSVEGAKVTYTDLIKEAEILEADDIIDVRIDTKTSGKPSLFDWFSGWTRTFTYTGTAIAIKYVSNAPEGNEAEPLGIFRR